MKTSEKLCCLITLSLAPLTASAADFTVTDFSDSADGSCDAHCSLREAIQAANLLEGADRIILQPGTYTLSLEPDMIDLGMFYSIEEDSNQNGDLDIEGDLYIAGRGDPSETIINATGTDRLFDVLSGHLRLSRLTLTGGYTTYRLGGGMEGGAILNYGQLTLYRCIISDNRVYGGENGGALANYGSASINQTGFINNYLSSDDAYPAQGGAVWNSGQLSLYNSYFRENTAWSNLSQASGAGLWNSGTVRIRETTFSDNLAGGYQAAGGALFNSGSADIHRSLFYRNSFSATGEQNGLAVWNASAADMHLYSSTITAHSSEKEDSAAVYNASAADFGGQHLTIWQNNAVGFINAGNAALTASILAGSQSAGSSSGSCSNSGSLAIRDTLTGSGINSDCQGDYSLEDSQISLLLETRSDGSADSEYIWHPVTGATSLPWSDRCPLSDQLGQLSDPDGDGLCVSGAVAQ